MKTSSIARQLQATLSGHFDIVPHPDHPFLFLGPDLLVGVENGIAGIFIMHAAERSRPADLLVRMAMSRVAYPDNFFAVLFLPKSHSMLSYLKEQFDAAIEFGEIKRAGPRLNNLRLSRNVRSLQVAREATFAQAEILYSKSLSAEKKKPGAPQLPLPQSLSAKLETASSNWLSLRQSTRPTFRSPLAVVGKCFVSSASLRQPSQVQPRLTRFGRRVFMNDHRLDNGIPYRYRPSHNLLLVDRRPIHRTDPDKWLRAAAFAGFAVVEFTTREEVFQAADEIERSLSEVI